MLHLQLQQLGIIQLHFAEGKSSSPAIAGVEVVCLQVQEEKVLHHQLQGEKVLHLQLQEGKVLYLYCRREKSLACKCKMEISFTFNCSRKECVLPAIAGAISSLSATEGGRRVHVY